MKMSPGRQMGTSLGRQIRTSPGHQMGTSPGRSNRMFRGHSGDVGRGRPRDVLGTNICRLGKLQDISKGITSNKFKHLLVENELKKIEKFDAAYFRGKNYFDVDDTQIYLVFQPIHRYLKHLLKIILFLFLHGNQKDCLMKKLVLLKHLIMINPPG